MPFPIQCLSCQTTGEVLRVTASLTCPSCGSDDLDLWDGTKTAGSDNSGWDDFEHHKTGDPRYNTDDDDEEPEEERIAPYLRNKYMKESAAHGPGTGWNQAHPDPLRGWDDYVGPTPGPNPLVNENLVADVGVCPACKGSGYDDRASGGGYEEHGCRLCHGTGRYTPTTSQPPVETLDAHTQGPAVGGARWQGKSAVTAATVTGPDGKSFPVEVTITPALQNVMSTQARINKIASSIKKMNALSDAEALALATRTVESFPEGE